MGDIYTRTTETLDKDSFEELVTLCIEAYKITYSDTTALDANGVLGKQRVMILEDERYQRETKIIKARRTISDLREIQELTEELTDEEEGQAEFDIEEEAEEEEDEEDEEEEEEEDLDGLDEIEAFDIRNRAASERAREKKRLEKQKEKEKKEKEKERKKKLQEKENAASRPAKPPKVFDKAKLEMRLKLIAQRREILAKVTNEEEKEGDALNVFFIPVTREEFEKIGTVEVSTGVSTASNAFDGAEEDEISRKLKEKKQAAGLEDGGTAFHYEEIDGEMVMVED